MTHYLEFSNSPQKSYNNNPDVDAPHRHAPRKHLIDIFGVEEGIEIGEAYDQIHRAFTQIIADEHAELLGITYQVPGDQARTTMTTNPRLRHDENLAGIAAELLADTKPNEFNAQYHVATDSLEATIEAADGVLPPQPYTFLEPTKHGIIVRDAKFTNRNIIMRTPDGASDFTSVSKQYDPAKHGTYTIKPYSETQQ